MCCQPGGSRGGFGGGESHYGCCSSRWERPFRRFVSAREEREQLEEYRDQLQKELAGVEERIQELKGK
jgi:hypothetical protein